MSRLAAESIFAKPLEYLANLIADSAHWQAICQQPAAPWPQLHAFAQQIAEETADGQRELALERVLMDIVSEDDDFEDQTTAPFVLVRMLPGMDLEQRTHSSWEGNAPLLMEVYLPVPECYQGWDRLAIWNAGIDHENKIGVIISDMMHALHKFPPGRLNPFHPQIDSSGLISPKENNGHWERVTTITVRGHVVSGGLS